MGVNWKRAVDSARVYRGRERERNAEPDLFNRPPAPIPPKDAVRVRHDLRGLGWAVDRGNYADVTFDDDGTPRRVVWTRLSRSTE